VQWLPHYLADCNLLAGIVLLLHAAADAYVALVNSNMYEHMADTSRTPTQDHAAPKPAAKMM
jgi:hypothetical protein